MASPAVASRGGTVAVKPVEQAGDRIGRYKLLQQIGEGGCGVVYMAEQEEPVSRRVALKISKLSLLCKENQFLHVMKAMIESKTNGTARVFSYDRWSTAKQTSGDSARRQSDPA